MTIIIYLYPSIYPSSPFFVFICVGTQSSYTDGGGFSLKRAIIITNAFLLQCLWLGQLARSCKQLRFQCHHIREIYQLLLYYVNFNIAGSFEIHWVRQYMYLVNVILIGIKDLQTFEMAVEFKSTLYVESLNIFPKFWHWYFE